jgi:hypothetical protein
VSNTTTVSQYLRQFSLVVADANGKGLDLSALRCSFTTRRGDFQNPNSCNVRVYNLSDNTASLIQGEFSQLALQAGYNGNLGKIFGGTIKQVRKGRVDAKDSYVDITAADGDEAYNFAPCAFTLAAGTTPIDSAQALIASLVKGSITQQLSPPTAVPTLPTAGRVRGRVFYGMTRDELRDYCKAYGLQWSIQDGVITFIPLTGYLAGPIPVLTPSTGIVGVPEQTQNGIEITTLLDPSIKIGQLIQLKSTVVNLYQYSLDTQSQGVNLGLQAQIKTNADGLYYVMVATHDGDTRGQNWYTHLTCLAVDASIYNLAPGNPISEAGVLAYG